MESKRQEMFHTRAEQFLSNNKAGPCHSNSLSLRNCIVRVPGSFNSKLVRLNEKGDIAHIAESGEIKIMQEWNGFRPSIKPLLTQFYIYLADSKIKENHRSRNPRNYSARNESDDHIQWIETLLQIPISDHRKKRIMAYSSTILYQYQKAPLRSCYQLYKYVARQVQQIKTIG
jgi:hypothetical protein